MKNAAAWEADFCSHMAEVESSTREWLDTLAQHTQLQEKQTEGQSPAEVRLAAQLGRRSSTTQTPPRACCACSCCLHALASGVAAAGPCCS